MSLWSFSAGYARDQHRCPGGPEEILLKTGMSDMLTELDEHALAAKMREVYAHLPPINEAALDQYDVVTISKQYVDLTQR
jgi:hypothetical protein